MRTTLFAAAALVLAALPAPAYAAAPADEIFETAPRTMACGYYYRCDTDFRTGKRYCYKVPCLVQRPF